MAFPTNAEFTKLDAMRQKFEDARAQQNAPRCDKTMCHEPACADCYPAAEIPAETPREALFRLHEFLTGRALHIMRAKNHDYSTAADPFRNFRTFGLLGVLVRLSDKLARLRSFEEQGVTKVSDESITDTIVDIINYAVIFEAMRCGN